jgi:hypothetical protein
MRKQIAELTTGIEVKHVMFQIELDKNKDLRQKITMFEQKMMSGELIDA